MSGWSTFHGSPPGDSCQFVCSSSSALCPTSIMSQTCSPMSSTTIASSGEDMFQQAASHQPFAGHSGPLVASPQPILLAQGPHVLGHLQMASVLITGAAQTMYPCVVPLVSTSMAEVVTPQPQTTSQSANMGSLGTTTTLTFPQREVQNSTRCNGRVAQNAAFGVNRSSTRSKSISSPISERSLRTAKLNGGLSVDVKEAICKLEEELEAAKKSLECPICMSSKIKVALHCGHCTCALCFIKIVEREEEAKCPVCRKTMKSYTVLYIN